MERLGLHSAEDVLSYYPFRYEVLAPVPFSEWKIKEKVVFEGEVVTPVHSARFGSKKSVCHFDVMSEDRILHITIFNRPWAKQLAMNEVITIHGIYNGSGKVTALSYTEKTISEQDAVTPVYALKEGMTQRDIRTLVKKAYDAAEGRIEDVVPECFISSYRLLHRADAVRMIHFPASPEDVRQASRTLKYEEFLLYFTAVGMLKRTEFSGDKVPRKIDEGKLAEVIGKLPYRMTADQVKSLQDILLDMSSAKCMYRLLQGDVGCGKTLVAALAMYACVLGGGQAALLAPTEILAVQHDASLREILEGTGVRIRNLYAGMPAKEQDDVLKELEDGSCDIVTGTHSLIQERVRFKDLGLVVADEQHRFGVEQRKSLRMKGANADFLLMSATPIPRTLASTLYGDMDISTIETLPPGRKPVITKYIHENSFRSVLDEVMSLLEKGRQLYVICAAVEANEDYQARNVIETAANLSVLFKGYRVGYLHGRMSSEQKQTVMNDFASGKTNVLVSTTVVEVGVNVVNATGMIIYDADRFGMSQIHQLRGRVQRGSEQGICWLLSSSEDEKTSERLSILEKSSDGFEIAYQDLRLRGPGDILGTKQSGTPDFILANPAEDARIAAQARKDGEYVLDHPEAFAGLIARVRKNGGYGEYMN